MTTFDLVKQRPICMMLAVLILLFCLSIAHITVFSADIEPDITVENMSQLKAALEGDYETVGISGLVTVTKTITIDKDITLVGVSEGSGFSRSSDFKGTMLYVEGSKDKAVNFNLENVVIDGSETHSDSSALVVQYSNITISNSSLSNNILELNGRSDEKNVYGGTICAEHSNLQVNDTEIINNGVCGKIIDNYVDYITARIYGGTVYISDSSATFDNCRVNNNRIDLDRSIYRGSGDGIVFYLENGSYDFIDSTLDDNDCTVSITGVIYCNEDENQSIELNVGGCEFSDNDTIGSGGCIATEYSGYVEKNNRTITIRDSIFERNKANEGGAILCAGSDVTISDSKMNYNESKNGGAMLLYTSKADISNSEFNHNVSDGCSGSIHMWCSKAVMNNVDICYNQSMDEGGAMCLYTNEYAPGSDENGYRHLNASSVIFNGGNISHNKTICRDDYDKYYTYKANGGGVFIHTGGEFILNDGIIEDNSSANDGGGVYVDDEDWIDTNRVNEYTFDDKLYSFKYSDVSGRFYMNGGIVRNNKAVNGGGVFVSDVKGDNSNPDSAHFIMTGGVIRNNTAEENGGGVYVSYQQTPCVFTMSGDNAYIFDNLASDDLDKAGDDIYDETNPKSKEIKAKYESREKSDILSENCFITPINGEEITDDLKIPFAGWYIDEAADEAGMSNRFVNLLSPVPENGKIDDTTGLKAIWGGYLILYDSNCDSGESKYGAAAFAPNDEAEVSGNDFVNEGKIFESWNTKPDGTGETYNPGDMITMDSNVILYAIWGDSISGSSSARECFKAYLVKVDERDSDTRLKGAKFELYKTDHGKSILVGMYETDDQGTIVVNDLKNGTYVWKEVVSPSGYSISTDEYEFEIKGKNETITVANARTPVPSVFSDDHFAYIIGYPIDIETGAVTDDKSRWPVQPDGNITRAEVATIFFRLLSDDVRNEYITQENSFTDVKKGQWYNCAISTMEKMGIVNGRSDGSFGPNDRITRAEFAAMAARFDDRENISEAAFTDISDHWAKNEISISANNGWINGYPDESFRPDQFIKRSEAMTLVNRVLQRLPENRDDLLVDMIVWPDNKDTDKWYYLAVQEATNSHYYDRKNNGYEKWSEIREARDWREFED